jgi:hypothetical protein
MPVNIDNDYPEFRITDTLHQLVDRLNGLTEVLDSNIRQLDSATGNILLVVDSSGEGLVADSDLNISASAGKIDMLADSNISIHAGTNLLLKADKTVTVDAGDKIFLDADSGEILLRSSGTQFGALKKSADGHYLEFYSGLSPALVFDSTRSGVFSTGIIMPSTGSYSPVTDAKTVHGAINEIVSEHDSDHADHETRIGTLETNTATLRTDVDNNSTLISNLDSDLTTQQALDISNRLDTIEAQIVLINDRLDILEIFT